MSVVISDYFTLDNGGLPFLARLQQQPCGVFAVAIAKSMAEFEDEPDDQAQLNWLRIREDYSMNLNHAALRGTPGSVIGDRISKGDEHYEVVRSVPYIEVFIPKPSVSASCDGVSLLFKVGRPEEKRYMYVGTFVAIFESLYPIKTYESPLGNAETTDPFAIDTHNNIYLMDIDQLDGYEGPKQGVMFQLNKEILKESNDDLLKDALLDELTEEEFIDQLNDVCFLYHDAFSDKYPDLFTRFNFEMLIERL